MTSLFREDWCTESYRLTESDMSTGIAQFHTYDKKAKSRFLVALLSNESTLKKSLSPIQQLLDVACQDKDKWVNIVARLVNKQLECNEVHKNVIGESVSKVVDQLMTTKSCDEVNFDFFPQELKYLNADLYPSFQFDNVHCHHGGTIPSFMGNDRIESSAGSGISGPPASVPVRPPLMPSNSAPSYHSRPAPSAVSNQHRTSTATGAASAARQGSKQHAKILSMDDVSYCTYVILSEY